MCNQVLTWARKVTVGGQTRKAVFLLLADFADDKGRAWPSQETIAQTLEMSERTVRTAIKDLVDAGLLTRKARWRPDGTRGTDILRFDMDAVNRQELPVMAEQPANGAETTGKSRQINRQMAPGLPAADAGEASQEPPQGNHHQKLSEADASGVPAVAAPPSLSLRDRLWMDGVAALISLGAPDKLSRQMVGRWLRDQDGDAGRVLWAIEEAVTAGSGDPVPYVTRLLSDRTQNHGERTGAHSARNGGGTKFDNVAAGVALGTAAFRQRLRKRSGHDRERPDHEALPDDPGGTAAYPSAAIAYLAAYR